MNVDISLPLDRIHKPIRAALGGEANETTITAVDRRGRTFECRITCTPLRDPAGQFPGAIVAMEAA